MAKESRFRLGIGTGRPPEFTNPQEMLDKAVEYFEMETNATGICKPTISGLVFHLGFESRQSWYDYKKHSEFTYTILRLKTFIESCYEKNLHGFAWAGAAFFLKNFNSAEWKDEVIQHQNQKVEQVIITEKSRDDK